MRLGNCTKDNGGEMSGGCQLESVEPRRNPRAPKIAWRSTSERAPSVVVGECPKADADSVLVCASDEPCARHACHPRCHSASYRPSATPELKRSRNFRRYPPRHVRTVDSVLEDGEYVKLNQYKLMEEIGQGSYGIVKLAYNEQDKNLYAMKILDKTKLTKKFAFFRKPPPRRNRQGKISQPADPLGQVNREIAILKKLSHPNVVRLVEVLDDVTDNYLYMVFEYMERGCVLEIPTATPLTENDAWLYFRDILLGLEYLHFHGVVHRDIKCSNLLLSDTGRVKIADFGVSSEFEGLDAFLTGTAGTPAFMAPEALIEDSSHFYSGRAQDIWSLGITLYSFLYGKVPFWDAFIIALHRKIKAEPLEFPEWPTTSEEVKELIQGMLAKDPGFRLMLPELKEHVWVTKGGQWPLPPEEDNCQLVTVTEEEIRHSIRVIPRLDTLILIKAMGQRRRFCNPFRASSCSQNRESATRCASAIGSLSISTERPGTDRLSPNDVNLDLCKNEASNEQSQSDSQKQ